MKVDYLCVGLFAGMLALAPASAAAQAWPDAATRIAAQKDALVTFAFMDGVWRGTARTLTPSGTRHTITQTERIGPFLDGTVKVIEGRGYEPDGRVSFNALGILSWNPSTRAYSMRSYAMGYAGDFPVRRTDDGFSWEIPAGPATIRYTAVVKDGTWTEVGNRVMPDKDPVRFFEMRLQRLGDTDWPAGSAVDLR